MAFIEPMHRNKPNITYLLTCMVVGDEILVAHHSFGFFHNTRTNSHNPGTNTWMTRNIQILMENVHTTNSILKYLAFLEGYHNMWHLSMALGYNGCSQLCTDWCVCYTYTYTHFRPKHTPCSCPFSHFSREIQIRELRKNGSISGINL